MLGGQLRGLSSHLLAQFASRGEDNRLDFGQRVVDRLQDGDDERRRFSGAGAGLPDTVLARDRERNELGLNRCGVRVPDATNGSHHAGTET